MCKVLCASAACIHSSLVGSVFLWADDSYFLLRIIESQGIDGGSLFTAPNRAGSTRKTGRYSPNVSSSLGQSERDRHDRGEHSVNTNRAFLGPVEEGAQIRIRDLWHIRTVLQLPILEILRIALYNSTQVRFVLYIVFECQCMASRAPSESDSVCRCCLSEQAAQYHWQSCNSLLCVAE